MAINISELYEAAETQRLKALQTAQNETSRRLSENLGNIQSQYRSDVTSAQTASRISAIGLEEKLAARGLSGGNGYQRATSGYTESARIAQNNNLRSNLNQLATARAQSEQAARSDAESTNAGLMAQAQSDLAELRAQRARAQIDQYNADRTYQFNQAEADRTYQLNKTNADRTYALNQAQYELDKTNADREYSLKQQQYQAEQKQTAYENALGRWETYGVVLPADAKILGVPAGTRTSDSSYRQAKLAIERIKAYQ
ncbi:MAG: hypothetical protein ACI4PQ_03025 [Butyricicoccaceae bacterium]